MITLTVHCESELGIDKQLVDVTLDQLNALKANKEAQLDSPFGPVILSHEEGFFKLCLGTTTSTDALEHLHTKSAGL
jgi:hypothetical protein